MRCLFFVMLSLPALAQQTPPTLTAAEKKKLDNGDVIVRPQTPTDNKGVAAQSLGLVNAPASEVWAVIKDCSKYADFMPRTKKSVAMNLDGKPGCRTELSMPFPLTDLWSENTYVHTEHPDGSYLRTWALHRGTYHRNTGAWRLFPYEPDNSRTLVVYEIDSDPKMAVPDGLIRSAQTGSLPKVFSAIRVRVRTLADAREKTP